MTGAAIMSDEVFKANLQQRANVVEEFLKNYPLDNAAIPARLRQGMLYSLNAGGKRFRPALCMASAGMCGMDEKEVVPFAAAIEMIHTYSLIHDDLPAMDDDDLRRGRPSNHRAFDEATAILAGDGLLTDAFAVICDMPLPAQNVLAAARLLALAAGSTGMVGGQMLDMQLEGAKAGTLADVERMEALKTGAMIRASCVCGSVLAGASAAQQAALETYGAALGCAFQIADDILDIIGDTEKMGKPAGSDEKKGKSTYPALAGLEKSRQRARAEADTAIAALSGFTGPEADFLRAMANFAIRRAV